MSDAETETEKLPGKKSKAPLILGIVLALVGGGGGFYATWSGMLPGGESGHVDRAEDHAEEPAEVAFIPVEPLVISLGSTASAQHLRFRAELEVPTAHQTEVTTLLPRVMDVFNSYLRALRPADLEDQTALTRVRAQMLRRVQVVVGQGRINDLLIMEFVLN